MIYSLLVESMDKIGTIHFEASKDLLDINQPQFTISVDKNALNLLK